MKRESENRPVKEKATLTLSYGKCGFFR